MARRQWIQPVRRVFLFVETMLLMPEFTRLIAIGLENGLHLGPSSKIVQLAQTSGCQILLRKGDKTVDGTSMLDLMTLAAEHGSEIEVRVSGDAAEETLDALVRILTIAAE
jgi:phosphocarrier protein